MRCECRVRVHDQIRKKNMIMGAKTIDDKKEISENKKETNKKEKLGHSET